MINLIIDANPRGDGYSLNRTLAQRLTDHLGGQTKNLRIYDAPQGYFSYEYNQEWIDLVLGADRLIFPVPMWNFGIPAALKDFLDKVSKRGGLWDFDQNKNYIGLLQGKSAFIIMTSGEYYPSGSAQDFVVPYLRAILSFWGIREVKDFRLGGIKDKNLTDDQSYMDQTTQQMLKAFGLKA
jgi:FMN-dependent NADH-azoreductase